MHSLPCRRFDAAELRALRVSMGSFLELVQVAVQAIEELSPDAERVRGGQADG